MQKIIQKKTIQIPQEEFIAKIKILKKARTVFAANTVMVTGDHTKNQKKIKDK